MVIKETSLHVGCCQQGCARLMCAVLHRAVAQHIAQGCMATLHRAVVQGCAGMLVMAT